MMMMGPESSRTRRRRGRSRSSRKEGSEGKSIIREKSVRIKRRASSKSKQNYSTNVSGQTKQQQRMGGLSKTNSSGITTRMQQQQQQQLQLLRLSSRRKQIYLESARKESIEQTVRVARSKGFCPSKRITLKIVLQLSKMCTEIDKLALQGNRGKRGAPADPQLVSKTDKNCFHHACRVLLFGIPLIYWEKNTGLRPSPFKRIYRELCRLHPTHTLAVVSAKALYRRARKLLVKAGNDLLTEEERRQADAYAAKKGTMRHRMQIICFNKLHDRAAALRRKMIKTKKRVRIDWDAVPKRRGSGCGKGYVAGGVGARKRSSHQRGITRSGRSRKKPPAAPPNHSKTTKKRVNVDRRTSDGDEEENTEDEEDGDTRDTPSTLPAASKSTTSSSNTGTNNSLEARLDALLQRHMAASSSLAASASNRPNPRGVVGAAAPLVGSREKIDGEDKSMPSLESSIQSTSDSPNLMNTSRRNRDEYNRVYDALFLLAKRNVMRAVKHVTYDIPPATPPFEIPTETIMSFVLFKISLSPGRLRTFRQYFLCPASQVLLRAMVWITHLTFFQKHGQSQRCQQYLIRRISKAYVGIVDGSFVLNNNDDDDDDGTTVSKSATTHVTPAESVLRAHRRMQASMNPEDIERLATYKDALFKVYPFAIAQAVSDCWWFLCPASRHRMGDVAFKSKIAQLVCRILFGMNVCVGTIDSRRRALFPGEKHLTNEFDHADADGDGMVSRDEFIEMFGSAALFDEHDVDGDGEMCTEEFQRLMSLMDEHDVGGEETGDAGGSGDASSEGVSAAVKEIQAIQDNIVVAGVRPTTRSRLLAEAQAIEEARPKSRATDVRQGREMFRTHRTTALVQRYLELDYQSVPAGLTKNMEMTRTVPVRSAKCRVGGASNFTRTPSRQKISDKILSEYKREVQGAKTFVRLSRKGGIAQERSTEANCKSVLKKTKVFVKKFSMEIAGGGTSGSRERLRRMAQKASGGAWGGVKRDFSAASALRQGGRSLVRRS